MKKVGIHIIIFMILSPYIHSQTTLTVGTDNVCPDEDVLVPINVTNFDDIGAFTIFIGYDTTVLAFVEHLNENSETQGIFSNAMVDPSVQVGISWSSFNSANISSGKLVDLKFHYHGENCALDFNSGCELVNSALVVVDFTATNGSILQSDPIISVHPLDVTADEGDDVTLSIVATEVSLYQWQKSEDQGLIWTDINNNLQFEGVNSSSLIIYAISFEMNNFQFRCQLCYDGCCIYSEPALLFVNQLSVFQQYQSINIELLDIYPNPFASTTLLNCNISSKGQLVIKIYDYLGNSFSLINKTVEVGSYNFELDMNGFKDGLYVCFCILIDSDGQQICINKLIKNGIDSW